MKCFFNVLTMASTAGEYFGIQLRRRRAISQQQLHPLEQAVQDDVDLRAVQRDGVGVVGVGVDHAAVSSC